MSLEARNCVNSLYSRWTKAMLKNVKITIVWRRDGCREVMMSVHVSYLMTYLYQHCKISTKQHR